MDARKHDDGRRTPKHALQATGERELAEYTEVEGALGTGAPDGRGRLTRTPPTPHLDGRARIIATVVLVALALLSFFVVAEIAASPETHRSTISSLDEKKDTVMGLVGASSASSAVITLIPGDAGTPIADKLVDLSSDFLVVVAAIYLEKYLLTIAGFIAFKVLVPVSCLMVTGCLYMREELEALQNRIARAAVRLFVLGIAMYLVVPVSVFVSSMIEATYQESITATIEQAQQTSERIEQGTAAAATEEETDLITQLQNLPETLTNAATGWVEEAEQALNGFVEALAVMVVTSCLIPLLILVFFLWLVKVILGIEIERPLALLYPRTLRHRKHGGVLTRR